MDIAKKVMFHEMELDDEILEAITLLAWPEPTLIQETAIPLLLEGKDVLMRAPTGSGKTVAFTIPVIQKILNLKKNTSRHQCIHALILSPSKELCGQITSVINDLTIKCARKVRCVDISATGDMQTQNSQLTDKPDIVVATPLRAIAHLKANNMRLKDDLAMLVVNAADSINLFSFGYEDEIKELLTHLPKIYQGVLASATLSDDVLSLTKIVLRNPVTLKLEEPELAPSSQLQHYGTRTASTQWENGMPLQEVFLSDADVPPELAALARQVTKERVERARVRPTDDHSEDENQFFDAVDGAECLEVEDFEWRPMDSFNGTHESFSVDHVGSVESHSTAYGSFRTYWPDDFLQEIVDQTNQHATRITSDLFQCEWYPTSVHEILCLFAFWMTLGIMKMPTIKSCFSANGVLKTEVFSKLFTIKRYQRLVKALHFADERDEAVKADRLGLIRPIIDHLNRSFKSNYVPAQQISIDESLTLWKGRLNIKQFIPLKAAKFGIKTFELCESKTGYLWSFLVYTGKQNSFTSSAFVLKSTAVVQALMRPLLNKGYQLFMDNWYNSPSLARWLKRNKTDCVGTLRPHRSHVPKLVQVAPLKRGQLIARHSGDICVLSWQDKKRVNMISTCHGSATAMSIVQSKPNPNRPVPFKPQVVLDYNVYMGGVDLKDQMLEPYLLERKRCARWYMKLFKRLLNVSILNARILLESSTDRQDHLAFRLDLVESIINNHLSFCSPNRPVPPPRNYPIENTHWLIPIPKTSEAQNRQPRKRCVMCYRDKKLSLFTRYTCEACDVPLCVPCMKAYHTTP